MKVVKVLSFACLLVTASSSLYWPCDTNDDCTAKYSSCSSSSSRCSCTDFDTVFSSDFSKCLKTSLIGDQCEDSVQCNLMPTGANCKSGVCACADGETYVRGRCRTLNGLNQTCDTELDCYFGYDRNSVQCKVNVCSCAKGYYHRHGNICRRKSMGIGDDCVVDTDCNELGNNVKCKSLKCQIVNEIKSNVLNNNNNYTNINNNNITNKSNNNNNNNIQNTRTKEQTSTPIETTSIVTKSTPSDSDFNVVTNLENGRLSITSTNNNSIINNNSNNNYDVLNDTDAEDLNTESKQEFSLTDPTKKTREIAVQTTIDAFELNKFKPKFKNVTTSASNSSSSRRPSKQKRRQRCRPTVFRFNDDEKTLSTLSNTDDDIDNQEYGFKCSHNGLQCTGLPHSICSTNVCLCRQGYYNKHGKCFAELGEIAESSDECENQFEAETKKCICQKNFYYDYNLRTCRKPIQYHLSCTADNQCSPFGAAYCHSQIPRRCTCKEYAEYNDILQMCMYNPGLGSECETDDGCLVHHSMCSNHICVCQPNYKRNHDECLPGLDAECSKNEECVVDNSLCATTSASNGTQDQSKTCQCRKGFVHFKDECLKEAENIEEECVESEQCKPLLASCVDNKCSCGDKQHFQNGHCETKKALNQVCSTASECFVEKGEEKVECRNSVCQCKFGYRSDSKHRNCVAANKKNSSGRPSALKIITFMLIGSAILITSAALRQAYY